MTMHTLVTMIRSRKFADTASFVEEVNRRLCAQSVVQDEGGFRRGARIGSLRSQIAGVGSGWNKIHKATGKVRRGTALNVQECRETNKWRVRQLPLNTIGASTKSNEGELVEEYQRKLDLRTVSVPAFKASTNTLPVETRSGIINAVD